MRNGQVKVLAAGVMAGTTLLLTAAPVWASPGQESPASVTSASGDGLLTGNSVVLPISLPISLCGVGAALGVLGMGEVTTTCEAAAAAAPPVVASSSDGDGILAGNTVAVPVHVPIDLCGVGVAVGVLGTGEVTTNCAAAAAAPPVVASRGSGDGVLTGNSVVLPVHAPINVCGVGVGVGVLGTGQATCTCDFAAPEERREVVPVSRRSALPSPAPAERGEMAPAPVSRRGPTGAGPVADDVAASTATKHGGVATDRLPSTGAPLATEVAVGLGLLAAGAVATVAARRRLRGPADRRSARVSAAG